MVVLLCFVLIYFSFDFFVPFLNNLEFLWKTRATSSEHGFRPRKPKIDEIILSLIRDLTHFLAEEAKNFWAYIATPASRSPRFRLCSPKIRRLLETGLIFYFVLNETC